MSYYALPPQHLPAEQTQPQIRWAESERRYGAEVDRLLSNPSELAAFVASLRLLARADFSPANGCEEPAITAGSLGTAGAPGPAGASVVGLGDAS